MEDFTVKLKAVVTTVHNGSTVRISKIFTMKLSSRNWAKMTRKSVKEITKSKLAKMLKDKNWPARHYEGIVEDEHANLEVILYLDGKFNILNDKMMTRPVADFVQYFRAMRPDEKEMILGVTARIALAEEYY